MSTNGTNRNATNILESRTKRLAIIKYVFERGVSKYDGVEWDIRVNFPEGFRILYNEEIAYINKELGYEIDYHFGIFRARKIKKRDAKSNYELR